jgi:hypothetical protein
MIASHDLPGGNLCLACGLCCNGALFMDVELQPGDDSTKLAALGLSLSPVRRVQRQEVRAGNPKFEIRNFKFPQPCAALDGCRCQIYADRPARCREFECVLLKSVNAGRVATDAALRIIRTARRRVGRVQRLLRELGDEDEHIALSLRIRRVKKRLESGADDSKAADAFSRFTQAVLELNLLLSEAFYPGPDDSQPPNPAMPNVQPACR